MNTELDLNEADILLLKKMFNDIRNNQYDLFYARNQIKISIFLNPAEECTFRDLMKKVLGAKLSKTVDVSPPMSGNQINQEANSHETK